jgi:SAM-dependent methyltransferase
MTPGPPPRIRGPAPEPNATGDFRGLDFEALWRGRDRTTQIEREMIRRLLKDDDPRRRLELGTGNGRLSSTVRQGAREYVGVDLQPEFLGPLAESVGAAAERRFAAANLYHLPFRDATFTTIVCVRVFNFLERPEEALDEMRRVLVPGGRLLLTVHTHPSSSSLVDDLKIGLGGSRPAGFRPRGLRRDPRMRAEPASFPTWSWTRTAFRKLARSRGWVALEERATGLEDLSGFRGLPLGVHLGLSAVRPVWGVRSTWYTTWGNSRPTGEPLVDSLSQIWACPKCRHAIAESPPRKFGCPACGESGELGPLWHDLRFVPGASGGAASSPRTDRPSAPSLMRRRGSGSR